MPIFQNIPDDRFDYNSDFVVKESKGINIMIGIFSLIFSVALFAVSTAFGVIALLGAVGAFVRSSSKRIIMVINREGFYYYGEFLTDWEHFRDVEFIDDVPIPSRNSSGINDRFYAMLTYYKDNEPGYCGRKIPFTDTQDQSEEEIIAAVKFYAKNNKAVDTVNS